MFEPNNGVVPTIKTIKHTVTNGVKDEGEHIDYIGQRFMYNGVFNQVLSAKHNYFNGWSILPLFIIVNTQNTK